jgi:hypothetical protein
MYDLEALALVSFRVPATARAATRRGASRRREPPPPARARTQRRFPRGRGDAVATRRMPTTPPSPAPPPGRTLPDLNKWNRTEPISQDGRRTSQRAGGASRSGSSDEHSKTAARGVLLLVLDMLRRVAKPEAGLVRIVAELVAVVGRERRRRRAGDRRHGLHKLSDAGRHVRPAAPDAPPHERGGEWLRVPSQVWGVRRRALESAKLGRAGRRDRDPSAVATTVGLCDGVADESSPLARITFVSRVTRRRVMCIRRDSRPSRIRVEDLLSRVTKRDE